GSEHREKQCRALRDVAAACNGPTAEGSGEEPVRPSLADHTIVACRVDQRIDGCGNRKHPLPPFGAQLLPDNRIIGKCWACEQESAHDRSASNQPTKKIAHLCA